MEAKEKWIEETLKSLDGVGKPASSPFLYEKVINRLQKQPAKVIAFPKQMVWRVAASVAILAALNFYTCFHYDKSTAKNDELRNEKSLAADYFSYMNNDLQF